MRLRFQNIIRHLNPAPNPVHAGDGHAVSERLVSRSIGGWLLAIGDEGVVVGKSLETFTLARGEAADG